jgi:hypothetical protein
VGGILPHPITDRVYLVESSDGNTTYRTSRDECTCPAGRHGLHCYHQALVVALTELTPPTEEEAGP